MLHHAKKWDIQLKKSLHKIAKSWAWSQGQGTKEGIG